MTSSYAYRVIEKNRPFVYIISDFRLAQADGEIWSTNHYDRNRDKMKKEKEAQLIYLFFTFYVNLKHSH